KARSKTQQLLRLGHSGACGSHRIGRAFLPLAGDMLASCCHKEELKMELKRAGSRPLQHGPADWFTGKVIIEPLSNPPEPSRIGCASVTFSPGARTAWHT